MKFLHTSDWHLGISFGGGISFAEDQRFAIDKICGIAKEEQVDGILLAGDVFDRSIASTDALHLYDEIMTHLCGELGIPVYLIAGNHDGAERLSQCNELLKKSGLFIAGALTKQPQCVNVGDVDIYLLPWISTDKVRAVYPDDADQVTSMEAAYKVVLDKYRASFVPGHKNILVAHTFITNASTSVSDRAAEVGRATMVGSFVFDGFDYVALGHLHGPQQIGPKIRYSGTPMIYSFGKEEKQEKSVTIIDTDSGEQRTVPIPQLRRRTTLHGTYEELIRGDVEDEIRNGYVRIEVTDRYVGTDTFAAFKEVYGRILEISGKSLEREDAKITMTIEEFEQANTDPEAVFARYCKDILEEDPGERLIGLFRKAVEKYEKGVNAQ